MMFVHGVSVRSAVQFNPFTGTFIHAPLFTLTCNVCTFWYGSTIHSTVSSSSVTTSPSSGDVIFSHSMSSSHTGAGSYVTFTPSYIVGHSMSPGIALTSIALIHGTSVTCVAQFGPLNGIFTHVPPFTLTCKRSTC